ncbi:MAG: PQQ-dependent dehydrogenase, methanol/ethanol family [Acidobacteria bacterium]|nr:PQQ-dependent dehydrogenase, methanol/ethanol family [Acidobacteriota bacterium]
MRLTLLVVLFAVAASAQSAADLAAGRAQFESRCGGCHGGDGKGGPRAPDVVTPGFAQRRDADQVKELIRKGVPDRGMPGFEVPEPALGQLVAFYLSLTAPASQTPPLGGEAGVADGEKLFFSSGCANCHVRSAEAKVIGPDLSSIGADRTRGEIVASLEDPSARIEPGYEVVSLTLRDGEKLRAFARNRSLFDLQLQTFDGRFRFLDMDDVASATWEEKSLMGSKLTPGAVEVLADFLSRQDGKTGKLASLRAGGSSGALPFSRIVEPEAGQWPTYNGDIRGNRHSSLTQITPENVKELRPAWVIRVPNAPRDLEMTPLVSDGVMYVTAANTVMALDAEHGREIWTWQRPRTPDAMGDARTGANRGVGLAGDKVFYATDDAHLVALDRLTGRLLWETEMADHREHYGGTLAPLVVKDLVLGGVGGGDEGIRGFLAAYDVNTGAERWRFWTVPLPGEPLSETWKGSVLPHGCGGTWLTGTYDAELDTLYWPVGNPCPDMNGDEREGDNLYSDSMLALDPDTGKLKWHYQYTPHDEFDWDANQTPVLVDRDWQGKPRKLLLHANRNGFFYVLDRVTGELLRAEPFVEKMTWAERIDENGRPVLADDQRPTFAGNIVCPGMAGAANWPSPAYDPRTGLFVIQATEYCQIYNKREETWQQGKGFFGGSAKNVPGEKKKRYLRALSVDTGKVEWDVYQGDGGWRTWGGVLSTDSGLVFYGDDSGAFAAVRSSNGERLWHFNMDAMWHSSPMTYTVNGKQYVATSASRGVVAFALPD